ncbi:MAG: glycosyltransferase family 9 protein [Chthoniobacterales bacterium]
MAEPAFRRALVIRGGALGDFLLTLPVLAALREAEPAARLEVLAYPGIAELARAGGIIDHARSIEYGPLAGFFINGAVLEPALRDYFASFDVVISYLYDPDGFFRDNLRTAGVRRLVPGPPRISAGTHAIDQLATPLAELGLPLAERAVRLSIPPAAPDANSVYLHPGSGSASKNWPAENWLALAEHLLDDPTTQLAIIGGEADAAALETMRRLSGNPRVRFRENLPLPALAAELAGAGFYLGHDTGVSHLAAAVGAPSLLLFGPTDPGLWAPPHPQVRVLRAPEGKFEILTVDNVSRAAQRLRELASGRSNHEN